MNRVLGVGNRPADTIALASLVPDDVISATEKRAAQRAGCPSVGFANERLRVERAGESLHMALPLTGIRLRDVTMVLGGVGDNVASAMLRVMERRGGRVLFAPIEIVFSDSTGPLGVLAIRGALVGLCGLATGK